MSLRRSLLALGTLCIALGFAAATRAQSPSPAPTPAFESTDFKFPSSGVQLVGRLFVPRDASGDYPLVILVQGSDYDDANASVYWRLLAHTLAKNGIASFSFNKRGVAGSGGRATNDLDLQAADVAAACRFALTLPHVAHNELGMYGISQAGWVVPRALKGCPARFVVLVSPAGVTPAEQVDYYLQRQFARVGMTPAQSADALALHRAAATYFRLRQGYGQTQRIVNRAVASAWYSKYLKVNYRQEIPDSHQLPTPKQLAVIDARDPTQYAFYRDPTTWLLEPAVYETLRVPILFVYGGMDDNLPVERSIAIFQSVLRQVANPDVTFHIFETADHSIQVGPRLLPGYREYIAAWILDRARTTP